MAEQKSQDNLSLWKNKTALVIALEKIPFFDTLTGEELAVLINYMSLYELEPEEVLFKEGEVGQYVCFVVEGVVEVLKKSITGSEIVLTTLSQGVSIGEMSLIDQTPRSATVKARTNVTFAVLPQSGFKLILTKHPTIGIKILIGFARFQTENLRKTSNQLNAYTHLLSTICAQQGKEMPNVEKKLLKSEEDLVKDTQSISSLSSSKSFLKKLKKVLTMEIIP